MINILILTFCFKAVAAVGDKAKQAWKNLDIVRYVDSDLDPKTGEDRIWHVYDKGQLPSWKEEQKKKP